MACASSRKHFIAKSFISISHDVNQLILLVVFIMCKGTKNYRNDQIFTAIYLVNFPKLTNNHVFPTLKSTV